MADISTRYICFYRSQAIPSMLFRTFHLISNLPRLKQIEALCSFSKGSFYTEFDLYFKRFERPDSLPEWVERLCKFTIGWIRYRFDLCWIVASVFLTVHIVMQRSFQWYSFLSIFHYICTRFPHCVRYSAIDNRIYTTYINYLLWRPSMDLRSSRFLPKQEKIRFAPD